MSTITFDTLQYVDTLTSAGVPEAQAKAMAKAQAQAIDSATDIRLATKGDIQDLKNEMLVMKWMLATSLAGTGAIVMKLFFMH
jgi:hypothetical protein